jgi:hypothetical protein
MQQLQALGGVQDGHGSCWIGVNDKDTEVHLPRAIKNGVARERERENTECTSTRVESNGERERLSSLCVSRTECRLLCRARRSGAMGAKSTSATGIQASRTT